MLAEDHQSESLVGRFVNHYKILSLIGKGGMGEVYLAQDTKLKRSIALKLLLAELTRNEDRVRRFEQEACAASALNHPNILTIYEIGQTNFAHFIATEYIDGVTLREHMAVSPSHRMAPEGAHDKNSVASKQMKLSEVLDVALQTTAALAAAHRAGIVHRDIKPENIMVRRDALVKVLDFGLAKLTEEQSSAVDDEALTRQVFRTEPGLVLGTPRYMSPEQARGVAVDARTDIWSTGVVLYEMIAGHAPFAGATASDMIAQVIEREPAPLAQYREEVPAELQRIVAKALRKDREERYQTIKDMLVDLRSLKQELEFEAKLERSAQPNSSSSANAAQSGSQPTVKTEGKPAIPTGAIEAGGIGTLESPHATAPGGSPSSAEYLVGEIKRHKQGAVLVLVTLVIAAVAVVAFGVYRLVGPNQPAATASFQTMKLTKLTSIGKATCVAVSPDGKYVVHVVDEGGQQSLWIRQVTTQSNVQIVPRAEVVYRGAIFSPDGDYIYYVVVERNSPVYMLYQVPVLGGNPRRIIERVDSAVTFSPDGKRLAFVRRYFDQEETALIVANADGSGEQKLATRTYPGSFGQGVAIGPSWSPDGKTIACAVRSDTSGVSDTLVEIEVESKAEKPLTAQRWSNVGQIAWLGDGSGVVLTAAEQAYGVSQVWYVSRRGGAVQRITNDLHRYQGVSLTRDSSTLATVQSERISDIWVAPNGGSGAARDGSPGQDSRAAQITSGGDKSAVSWAPDGRIAYASNVNGNYDIWIIDRDGTNQKQLTTDPRPDRDPSVCAGGRYIVFNSTRAGPSNIWRMDIDGSNPKQLTSGTSELYPHCSPDGQWVIFQNGNAKTNVSKISIDGGSPVALTDKDTSKDTRRPIISPDGKWIACIHRNDASQPWRIAIIPFEGGQPSKLFEVPRTVALPNIVRWTPDGRAITYIDMSGGVSNIWSQPLDEGSPKQLTDFKTDRIFSFDWSRDGNHLALVRGAETSDVVMIKDFR